LLAVRRNTLGIRSLIHFIPSVLSFIALLPGWLSSNAYRMEMDQKIHKIRITDYQALFAHLPDIPLDLLYIEILKLVSVGTKTSLLVYFLVLFRRKCFFPKKNVGEGNRTALNATIGLMCAGLLISISNHFFQGNFFLYALIVIITTGVFAAYIIEEKFLFFKHLTSRKSQIFRPPALPADPEESTFMVAKLQDLMRDTNLYREENLSLREVAERLEIKPYRLSKAINDVLSKSFVLYINELRVQEAQQLLLQRQDLTVLRISLEVGFSSKSAFNRAFRTISKKSPEEYRLKGESIG